MGIEFSERQLRCHVSIEVMIVTQLNAVILLCLCDAEGCTQGFTDAK